MPRLFTRFFRAMERMDRKKNLETILVIVTGFLILYILTDKGYWLFISVVVGVVGLIIDPFARGLSWLWYKIAEFLGRIVSTVLLTVVFYFLLLPLALLYRLKNKDLLELRNINRNSMWVERKHRYTEDDILKPF